MKNLLIAAWGALCIAAAAQTPQAPEIAAKLQAFLVERFPELSDSTSIMRKTLAQIAASIQS